jgi:hypothetical protein
MIGALYFLVGVLSAATIMKMVEYDYKSINEPDTVVYYILGAMLGWYALFPLFFIASIWYINKNDRP